MNERIKELYIQTCNETADGKEWAIGGLTNAKHFAELIVRECIKDVNTLCKYKQMILIPDEQYKMHCLGVLTEAAAYIRNQWGLKDEPTN